MKKVFSLLLLLATTVIALSSCSKDNDNDIKKNIIGTWDATSIKFEDTDWIDITNRPTLALSITFKSDGTYYGKGALGDGGGTYTISDKTIRTYIDGELYGTYVVNTLSGNHVELSLTMGKSTMGIRAQKR